jgi:predicted RNA-binding protein
LSWIYIKKKIFTGSLKFYTILINSKEREEKRLSMKSKTSKSILHWKIRRKRRRKTSANKHKITPTQTTITTTITTIITTITAIRIKIAKRIRTNSLIEKKEYFPHSLNIPKSTNPYNQPSLLDGSSTIATPLEIPLKTQFPASFKKLPNPKTDQLSFKTH